LKEEADVYLLKSQFDEALDLYREGIRLYPSYAPNYLTLGTLYLQTDRPAEALPLYRKALSCDLDAKTRLRVAALVHDLESALRQKPQPAK
jgi:tetratricopeptide (TPR) repeat protein